MKKITIILLIIVILAPVSKALNFKQDVLTTWYTYYGFNKVEILFKDDNTFTYTIKEKTDEGLKVKKVYNGKYKLHGRNLLLDFGKRKYLRMTLIKAFYGRTETSIILKDETGKTYNAERPQVEVQRGNQSNNNQSNDNQSSNNQNSQSQTQEQSQSGNQNQ